MAFELDFVPSTRKLVYLVIHVVKLGLGFCWKKIDRVELCIESIVESRVLILFWESAPTDE